MKAMTSTFAILAIACATVTGIVLAQSPSDQRSPNTSTGTLNHATSVEIGEHPVLGKVLFEHVTCVHFSGVAFPANSDGTLGGWVVADEHGAQHDMKIYENHIIRESVLPDGTVCREIRPYDTLGRIEQRIPASEMKPAKAR